MEELLNERTLFKYYRWSVGYFSCPGYYILWSNSRVDCLMADLDRLRQLHKQVVGDRNMNPWKINHPGWEDFTAHKITKWKHRFVVTALNGEQQAIIGFLNKSTGLHYSCIEFSEKKLFPDLEESYQITCAYFFPTEERDYCANLTSNELNEIYWY